MSNPPANVWQTASRTRPSHSASRTPQNRSSNASPAPSTTSVQPPRQNQSANTAWTQRNNHTNTAGPSNNAGAVAASNGQPKGVSQTEDGQQHTPVNGFNAEEVKAYLGRQATGPAYKVAEVSGAGRGAGTTAWGVKGNTANNQPFFAQLAKQIATLEGGG